MTVAPPVPNRSEADMLRRGAGFSVATAVQAISALAFLPILTTLATTAEVGTIAAGQLVMQVSVLIAALGLPGLVTRDYFELSNGPLRSRRLVGVSIVLAPLVIGSLHLAGPFWSLLFANLEFELFLVLALWAAWPRTAVVAALAVFRAELRVSAFVTTSVASLVGSQLVAIVAFWWHGTITSFFGGFLAGHTAAAILAIAWCRPVFRGWGDELRLLQVLRLSVPIAANSAAGLVMTTGDRVVIERLLGLEEVGRYQIVYVVASLGIVLLLSVNNAWGPAVFAAPAGTATDVLASTTRTMSRLALRVAVGLAAGGPIVLSLIAPSDYQLDELSIVLALVASASVPLVFYLSGNHLSLLNHRTARLAVATAIAATTNIVLNIALIPPFELEGAALATLLSYGVWALALHINAASRSIVWGFGTLVFEGVVVALVIAAFALVPATGVWLVVRVLATGVAGVAVLTLGRRSLSAELGASKVR